MHGEPIPITTIKDPRVIFARSLKTASGRSQSRACLLFGLQPIKWAMQADWLIKTIFFSKEYEKEILDLQINCETCLVSDGIMKKISDTSYLVPVLSVASPRGKAYAPEPSPQLVLLLDSVRDHGNIGTIVRSSCAFGINHIALCEMDSDLFQRKIIDASRGSVFRMHSTKYSKTEAAIKHWKEKGYQIVVTTPYGSGLQSELKLENKPVVLVIGNETEGVQQTVIDLADACIQIPMQPEMESLNVGVAAGISLYEIKIKTVFAMLKQNIQTTLGREINVAGKLLMNSLDREFKQISKYSAREAVFLMQLSCDQEMTISQISQETGFFDNDLNEFLNHLSRSGFIQPSSTDQKHWIITNMAEQWLAEIWPVVESSQKKALKGFSENEINLLADLISRIQMNCLDII